MTTKAMKQLEIASGGKSNIASWKFPELNEVFTCFQLGKIKEQNAGCSNNPPFIDNCTITPSFLIGNFPACNGCDFLLGLH